MGYRILGINLRKENVRQEHFPFLILLSTFQHFFGTGHEEKESMRKFLVYVIMRDLISQGVYGKEFAYYLGIDIKKSRKQY